MASEMVAVAIPLSEYKRLLEMETRVKVLAEMYNREGIILTEDVADILNFERKESEHDPSFEG